MAFSDSYARFAAIKDSREQVREQKKQRDQELQKLGYSFDGDNNMSVRPDSAAEAEQLQAKQTAQLAKTLQGKLAAQDTDQAFLDYASTGDASYLQKAMDNNPYLKQAWGQKGVQQVGNIDFSNDTKLLDSKGLKPSAYDTPEKQATIRKNLYKVYDGKDWNLGLLNNAAAETGALNRLGPRRGGDIVNNGKEFNQLVKGPKSSPNTVEGHKYEKEIMAASEETGIPPDLLASMMNTESSNNPNAVSSKGATGLMQLMPDAATEVGVTDRNDPAQNIMGGAKYLKKQLEANGGDFKLALAAYNAGPGNVKKYGGIPPFGETQNYVNKVIGNLDDGQQYYGNRADTILQHMQDIANATQGTSTANVNAKVDNEIRQTNQTDVKLAQADRALNQDDRKLDQGDTANVLKLEEIKAKLKTDGSTSTQKDLSAAADTTNNMLTEFGGEDSFNKTDFSDPKNFNKAYKSLVKIEKLEGTQLDESDKKSIRSLRPIIALAGKVDNLTEADTGMLDNRLGNMRKYLDDTVGGVRAKSAHQAILNLYIKAMAGTAVSPTELERQVKAFGTLDTKLAPALQQFQTLLMQTKEELATTASLMNPYSAKIRLGASAGDVETIMNNIDKTISYLQGIDPSKVMTEEQKAKRKPLNEVFGG